MKQTKLEMQTLSVKIRGGISKTAICGIVPVIVVYKNTYLYDTHAYSFTGNTVIGYVPNKYNNQINDMINDNDKIINILKVDSNNVRYYEEIHLSPYQSITVEMLNTQQIELYVGSVRLTSINLKLLPENPIEIDIHNWKYK